MKGIIIIFIYLSYNPITSIAKSLVSLKSKLSRVDVSWIKIIIQR